MRDCSLLRQLGRMPPVAGDMIAVSIVDVLFPFDALDGFVSKTMPQMNMHFLFLPFKAAVFLGVMVAALCLWRGLFAHRVNDAFSSLAHWLK